MKFSDVIGHEAVKEMLRRSVDEGRVSHAQLFSGDAGWGSLALAVAYAQYVNCTNRHDGDSCGVCSSCIKMASLTHPDLNFAFPIIKPPKARSDQKLTSDYYISQWRSVCLANNLYFDEQAWYEAMGVENQQGMIAAAEADEIIRKLSFKSFEAEYKVVIIWLPERLNNQASNKLLKILEEPWERTLFLLVSQMPERLITTITSRTQQVEVSRIDEASLAEYAKSLEGVDEQCATSAAHLADGSVLGLRRVLGEEQGVGASENFGYFADLMRLSYNDKHLELLTWAEGMAALGREAQKRFVVYSVGLLREAYMLSAGLSDISYLWGEEAKFCKNFSPFIGNHNIEPLVREFERCLLHISQNGNAKIVFCHFALAASKLIVRLK